MIAVKMQERFEELGYNFEAMEVNPGGVKTALMSGNYDFIAYTSPVEEEVDIPMINAVNFMTGFAEEEFMEEALKVLEELGKIMREKGGERYVRNFIRMYLILLERQYLYRSLFYYCNGYACEAQQGLSFCTAGRRCAHRF